MDLGGLRLPLGSCIAASFELVGASPGFTGFAPLFLVLLVSIFLFFYFSFLSIFSFSFLFLSFFRPLPCVGGRFDFTRFGTFAYLRLVGDLEL